MFSFISHGWIVYVDHCRSCYVKSFCRTFWFKMSRAMNKSFRANISNLCSALWPQIWCRSGEKLGPEVLHEDFVGHPKLTHKKDIMGQQELSYFFYFFYKVWVWVLKRPTIVNVNIMYITIYRNK